MIGRAGFRLSADGRHRGLGYPLEPAQWGRGLATELASALGHWHRLHPDGLEPTLHAYAFAHNTASRRVLEKSGFALDRPSGHDGLAVLHYFTPSAGSRAASEVRRSHAADPVQEHRSSIPGRTARGSPRLTPAVVYGVGWVATNNSQVAL